MRTTGFPSASLPGPILACRRIIDADCARRNQALRMGIEIGGWIGWREEVGSARLPCCNKYSFVHNCP